jgi:hypothetical protein
MRFLNIIQQHTIVNMERLTWINDLFPSTFKGMFMMRRVSCWTPATVIFADKDGTLRIFNCAYKQHTATNTQPYQ